MTTKPSPNSAQRPRAPPGRGWFLIIRGPLGSGKTTIAHRVAEGIGAEVVSIDRILDTLDWDGGSEALFLKANVIAAEAARGPLRQGVAVVFDGNFYWIRVIEDLLTRLPWPNRIFTLRAPLEVCIARDLGRTLSYGEESAREVFAKVTAFDIGIPIDVTRPIPVAVNDILSQLPEPCRPPT